MKFGHYVQKKILKLLEYKGHRVHPWRSYQPLFLSQKIRVFKVFLTKSHEIWTVCVKKNSAFFGVQKSPSTPLEVTLTPLFTGQKYVYI
jgi:hypothetical protein